MISSTARLVARWLTDGWRWWECIPSPGPPASFVVVVLLFAGAVRVAAGMGPLWLDEIWSLELSRQPATAAGVLTELHEDNNHPLNTLVLRAIGPGHVPLAYRLPSILAGLAAVWLAGRVAARWGRVESALAMTLSATSYLLVHYSSEARGYSFAICCGLLAWDSLWSHDESRSWPAVVLFWGSCVLGMLSHPIFLHVLVAALGWFVAHSSTSASPREEGDEDFVSDAELPSLPSKLQRGALLFGIPITLAAVMYWTQWRQLDLGGGPEYSLMRVLARTGSLAVGGPATGWGVFAGALVMLTVYGAAWWLLREDRRGAAVLLGLFLLVPLAQALALRPPFLFPRYFLVIAMATPIAAAVVLARLNRRGGLGAWWSAGLVLIWVAANLLPTGSLVRLGRGDYRAALQYIADHSTDRVVTVSSDHNFGVRKLLDYYLPQLDTDRTFEYITGDQWPPTGPEWVLFHRYPEDGLPAPPPQLVMEGKPYVRDRSFDSAILSGWQWWCYRRLGPRL